MWYEHQSHSGTLCWFDAGLWCRLPFNTAHQCSTTSWTEAKLWHADKLGSAAKMCVYCIELLWLKNYWRNHKPWASREHTLTHIRICTNTCASRFGRYKALFLSWSHSSSGGSTEAWSVGGAHTPCRMDDHFFMCAFKKKSQIIWYEFWRQLVREGWNRGLLFNCSDGAAAVKWKWLICAQSLLQSKTTVALDFQYVPGVMFSLEMSMSSPDPSPPLNSIPAPPDQGSYIFFIRWWQID